MYDAGTAALQVVPSFRNLVRDIRREMTTAGTAAGKDFKQAFDAAAGGTGGNNPGGGGSGPASKNGAEQGSAFARAFKTAVTAALRDLPEIKLDANSTQAEKDIARIRADLEALSRMEVGVDIDSVSALRQVEALRTELEALEANATDVKIKMDTKQAGAALARLEAQIAKLTATDAQVDVVPQSGFATKFRATVEGALRDLPEIQITANSTPAQRDIAEVRNQLATLRDSRIGVDIDATAALNQLEFLRGELERLGAETTDIDVKLDTALAQAQIVRLQAEITRLDAQDVDIDVDVHAAGALAGLAAIAAASRISGGGMSSLIAVGISLAPLIVPAAAAAAAAVAAIGGAALVGIAGLGAVALALVPVIGAYQAMGAAEKEANQQAKRSAKSQSSVAGAVAGVESAERSLANTRANAAESAIQAARAVTTAERSLVDAQRVAKAAQLALTAAREDARRALEDLDTQVKEGALAQRRATLSMEEAKRDLDRVLMDPTANKYQRDQARLTYEEATLRVETLRRDNSRLAEDKLKADKAGVEGSKQVQAAQEGVREANQRVKDANQGVADAIREQTNQARQSAFAIVQAQQGVISAQRSLAQATQSTAAVGGSAMDEFRKKMAGLTPAGRSFVAFLDTLKGKFKTLSGAAQTGFLPGLQRGLQALTSDGSLKTFERLVSSLSRAMGSLAERAGKALASPFWRDFFDYLGAIAGPTLTNIGSIIGDLAKGFASLLMAFTPTSKQMGDGFAGMAKSFADWAAGLKDNTAFQDFITYVKTNGPKVLGLIGGLLKTIGKIGAYLAPLGAVLLEIFDGLFEWLSSLSGDQFAALMYGLAAIGVAIMVLIGGPITLFIAGITLLVAGVVWAYNRFSWFKTGVDAVAKAIATVAVWLWQNVLLPVFRAIGWYITNVLSPVFRWLWEKVIKPAWAGISLAISWAWANVIQPVLRALSWFLEKVLGPAFSWLYENVIKPVWSGIKVAIAVAWAIIKVIFGLFQIGLKVLGAIFSWVYDKAIKPFWDNIVGAAKFAWERVLKPLFTVLGDFIQKHVAPGFSKGVEAIKAAWEKVQEVAKKPIGFILRTVLEGGLLAGYNKLAEKFGVGTVHIPKDILAKFADGGAVYGGERGRDSVPALLMPDEHIWTTKEVQAAGGHGAMHRIRRAALRGDLRGFAGGGGVGDWLSTQYHRATKTAGGLIAGAKDLITDPMGSLRRLFDRLVAVMPDKATEFAKVAIGAGRSVVGSMVEKLKGFVGLSGDPDPSVNRGSSPSTAAIIGLGRASGIPFNVTSTFRPGSRSLSGNLDNHSLGLAVDMASSVGNMEKLASWFLRYTPFLKELIHSGGRGYFVKNGRQVGRSFYGSEVAGHYDHVHVAATNEALANARRVLPFDSGGMLPRGLSMAFNGTGRPERVLTDSQWGALNSSRDGGMTLRVRVDDGAVRGLVMVEVEDQFGSLADAKVYGTG